MSDAARAAERARLVRAAGELGVAFDEAQAEALLRLLDELAEWNQRMNLTAIRDRAAMVTLHVLDSLAIQPDIAKSPGATALTAGEPLTVADVGTGAGFPGLPLALVNPTQRYTLIDSVNKKVRFVAHATRELGLTNVEAVHARAETFKPPRPFDVVVARALAPLPKLLATVRGLCGPDTRVVAMKGHRPDSEIAAVAAPWRVGSVREYAVPGLDAARCSVVCTLSP